MSCQIMIRHSVMLLDGIHVELKIPPSLRGSSATATFRLYFYLTNYMIDSVKIAIRNDTVIYGEEDLSRNGVLKMPRPLEKFLNISTTPDPSHISHNSNQTISITTELVSVNDSVTVIVPLGQMFAGF